ncbi:hypothetical protein C7M84_004213 [Penaeus vannamei]|uniref:Fibronectin type-III domain-containing protein n=1 Tax=Penaeus vannamei TaxID=6689 RepID=A0A423TL46_PENVA|nr:hypothetical protein C7M84_004213 [Penaeus vannamei]
MRNTNWKVNVLCGTITHVGPLASLGGGVAIHLRRLQPRNWQLHRAGPGTFLAGGGVDERARQGRGKGRCSATTDEAVPDEPSEVIVSKVTNTTAHISWTMPLHVNGAIKSWEVTLRGDTDNEETENDVEGEMMFFDATDLTPSTNYEVTVKCQTGGGLSKGTRRSFKTLNADNTGDNQPNIGLIIGLSRPSGIRQNPKQSHAKVGGLRQSPVVTSFPGSGENLVE